MFNDEFIMSSLWSTV